MADFDPNPRGGLNTNRESLHASAEYRRQVSALEQMKESEMAEKMTLEEVSAWHRSREVTFRRTGSSGLSSEHKSMADAIDAHLTQSAQAVDVPFPPLPPGLVNHPQLGPMFDRMQMQQYALRMTDSATRAIGNAQAEE